MCATPLQTGDKAPYAGELLTDDLAIQIGQVASGCQERINETVTREQGICAAQVDQEKQLHAMDAANLTQQLMDLQTQLAEAQKVAQESSPPFFLHPGFVGPVCGILGAGMAIWALRH